MVTLDAETPVDEQVLAFINRLSDALFAGARYANDLVGHPDDAGTPIAPLPAEGSASSVTAAEKYQSLLQQARGTRQRSRRLLGRR